MIGTHDVGCRVTRLAIRQPKLSRHAQPQELLHHRPWVAKTPILNNYQNIDVNYL